ncbi:unnamed protein product [Cuscuta epithymum]|uniref:Ubiquitin-like protease family profile domain-containing protein n=1 Tax=Cuscuta epithymum TaxID=186058 RepID=A0AAV0CLG6_9ASTE|nr:unnamed protein product [Cuscuta epithymum]
MGTSCLKNIEMELMSSYNFLCLTQKIVDQLGVRVEQFEQVSNSVVEIWARYLHERMEADGGNMPVQFGTSAAITIPKRASHQAVTRRSQHIADLLDISLLGQMTLIPYNTGNHWVLVAIDMAAETIYYLDSLGRIPSKDLEEIVNHSVPSRSILKMIFYTCVRSGLCMLLL